MEKSIDLLAKVTANIILAVSGTTLIWMATDWQFAIGILLIAMYTRMPRTRE